MTQRANAAPNRTQETQANYPISPFRLFEDFFNNWAYHNAQMTPGEAWKPPVDIIEKDGNILLRVEIPGVDEKDINLRIEGGALIVKGERKVEESNGYTYRLAERNHGAFSRSFTLPESADLGNIKADYKNGILTIAIPQKPEIKPRIIKVNAQ